MFGDVVLAVLVFGTVTLFLNTQNAAAGAPYTGDFMLLLSAMCSFPLLLRARWPPAAWRCALPALVWTSVPLQDLLEIPIAPGAVLIYLLCHSVAVRCHREVAVGAWIASVLALWGSELLRGAGTLSSPGAVFAGTGLVAVPLLLGHNLRERRQAQTKLADQERRNEEEQAARAVLQERSRIARELHDVVAHHMSAIAIQAEAARVKTPGAPAAVKPTSPTSGTSRWRR